MTVELYEKEKSQLIGQYNKLEFETLAIHAVEELDQQQALNKLLLPSTISSKPWIPLISSEILI